MTAPVVLAQRVSWRREGTAREYVGTLLAADGTLGLSGRDPATGIEVALSVPFEEIESVSIAGERLHNGAGEPCVLLSLAGSKAICLRPLGVGQRQLAGLAGRLQQRVARFRTNGVVRREPRGRRRGG